MDYTFNKSWENYKNTLEYIPGGSSTRSKAPVYELNQPAQIVRGKGCRVWDADGNEYIDFRNGLGPVTLGYCIPEINRAVAAQLERGIVFGQPHPLEGEVAQILVESIKCAEKARFLKTGGEAVSACVKIARSATGKNKIIHCGYNGWLTRMSGGPTLPGLASSQAEKGSPAQVAELHVPLPWGEISEWEKFFSREGASVAAAVIACDYAGMDEGAKFLPAVRALTQKYGALMIMDEIVTGFRLAVGGAHDYFDFMPDLAVFSKGIANGMPLAAYLGRKELLDPAPDIGITSTFGGETLSLAACKAVSEFYRQNNVIEKLWMTGKLFRDGINRLFRENAVAAELRGFPVTPVFAFEDPAQEDAFFKACYKKGVSLYNVPYVSYSHGESDIEEALGKIKKALRELS